MWGEEGEDRERYVGERGEIGREMWGRGRNRESRKDHGKRVTWPFPKTTKKPGTKLFPKTMDSVGHDFSKHHGQRGTRVFPKTTDSVGHGFSQRPRTAWTRVFPKITDSVGHGFSQTPRTAWDTAFPKDHKKRKLGPCSPREHLFSQRRGTRIFAKTMESV